MAQYVIYQISRNVMQSAKNCNQNWVLTNKEDNREFSTDSRMGWCNVHNLSAFFVMKFHKKESAVAYAKAKGWQFNIIEPKEVYRKKKNYNFNFTKDRNLYYY